MSRSLSGNLLAANLDLQEGSDAGSADRAGVVLQTHNLGAALAETEVPTRQHDCVLGVGVADDALGLEVTFHRHGRVVNAEHVVQVEDRLIVQQLLLERLELVLSYSLFAAGLEGAVCELNLLFGPALVGVRKHSLNADNDRVVVVLLSSQLVLLVLPEVKLADALLELLLEARAKHVGLRQRILLLVGVKAER